MRESDSQKGNEGYIGVRHRNRKELLLFRSGGLLLAVPIASVKEVIEDRVIHSIPYRRDGSLLGLANYRGKLQMCFSMTKLFHIGKDSSFKHRIIVLEEEGLLWLLCVDEVLEPWNDNSVVDGCSKNIPEEYLEKEVAYGEEHACVLKISMLLETFKKDSSTDDAR